MGVKRFLAEWTALAGTAVVCALVANALAAPQRKLDWVGRYPDATEAPVALESRRQSASPAAKPSSRQETASTQPVSGPAVSSGSAASPGPSGSGTEKSQEKPATRKNKPAPAAANGTPNPATQAAPSPQEAFPPHPKNPWVEISAGQVKELFDRGAPFFDARRTADYEAGHIPGARSIPVWEAGVDEKVKKIYQEGLDPSAPIVVYCSGGECEDSHMLAKKLWDIGLNNVLVYKDGFPDWQKRGNPVHQGSQP
jgi:rhodanese-related sulfurtransferase